MFALANLIKSKTSFNIFIKIAIALMTIALYASIALIYELTHLPIVSIMIVAGLFDIIATGMFLADMFL